MYWRLHKAIFQDRFDEAISILKEFKDTIQAVDGNVLTLPVPLLTQEHIGPALAITTIQDARQIMGRSASFVPWLFYNYIDYCASHWLPQLTDIPLLNNNCIFVPSGFLPNISSKLLNTVSNNHKAFIRPNSGNKVFTGYSINIDNWDYEIKPILEKTTPDVMLLLSPHIDLQPTEWRFWIVNNEVITYSPYSWDCDLDWIEAPIEAIQLATRVAKHEFQVDITYVLDIVSDYDNNYYVNEINATSTSGVYNVPLLPLLTALRKVAYEEYSLI